MTLKSYLWGIRFSTVLALAGWGLIVYFIDPQKSGILGQILFYLSLFLVLSGLFILILTKIHRKREGAEAQFVYIGMSFRQGILLALLSTILLIFQSLKVLTWWDGLLAVVAIFLAELYFLSR
jgi:hypothetical protein